LIIFIYLLSFVIYRELKERPMKFTIPNQLTILRVMLSPVFVYFFSFGSFEQRLTGAVIFVLAALTDWYDGLIARKYGVITRFGQFADPLADKILVLSAFFLFAWLKFISLWMVLIISFRDIFMTLIRIYAIKKNMPVVTHSLGKWKTFLQMTFVVFVIIYYTVLSYFYPVLPSHYLKVYYIEIFLFIITLITVYTLIVYIKENFQLIVKFFQEWY